MFETKLNGRLAPDAERCMVHDDPPAGAWWALVGEELVAVHRAEGKLLHVERGMEGTPRHQHEDGSVLRQVAVGHVAHGPAGERGPQGEPGPATQGPQGERGARGERGLQGPHGNPGIRWLGDYSEATPYEQGDGVRASDGLLYVSTIDANAGNDPAAENRRRWMALGDHAKRPPAIVADR